MSKKKYNFKILAKDIIYSDVDEFTIQEFKEKLSKFEVCPVCKKDWNKIHILKNHSSPLARDFIVPPDSIKDGWKIKNVKPICTTCNNRLVKEAVKKDRETHNARLKKEKDKKNIIKILMIGVAIFVAIGWYHGFAGWGGAIAGWILIIAMVLFIIAMFAL